MSRLRRHWKSFLGISMYTLGFYGFVQYDALRDPYWINDDWPQHLVWLYRFGPHFFQPNDVYMATSEAFQPWGTWLLARLAVLGLEPLAVSTYLPVVPLFLTCWFTFWLLHDRVGWGWALVATVMLSYLPLDRMVGLFARAYGFPLLLMWLYYWVSERRFGQYSCWVLAALLYPPVLLLMAGMWGLDTLKTLFRETPKHHRNTFWQPVLFLVIAGGVVALKSNGLQSQEHIGALFDQSTLLTNPLFGPGGRVNFVEQMAPWMPLRFPWRFYFDFPYSSYDWLWMLFLGTGFLLLRWRQGFTRLDEAIIGLFLSGTIWCFAAQLLLPRLFLPQRFLYFSFLPLLYLLLVRLAATLTLALSRKNYLSIPLAIVLLGATFQWKQPKNVGLTYYGQYRGVYEWIQQQQQPLLFAGPPNITSHIPTFCRQSVLFSDESAHAVYFNDYYDYVTPRLHAYVEAISTTDQVVLATFLRRYQVDYLIVEQAYLDRLSIWLFQPFQAQLQKRLNGIDPASLALSKVDPTFYLKIDATYQLLDVRAWLDQQAKTE